MLSRVPAGLPRLQAAALAAAFVLCLCDTVGPLPFATAQTATIPPGGPLPKTTAAPPGHGFSSTQSTSRQKDELRPLIKVRVDSNDVWRVLDALGAELYLKGDGHAFVRLGSEDLPALDSHGIEWKALSHEAPERLYLLMAEEGASALPIPGIRVLDVAPDVASEWAIVSADPEDIRKVVDLGYKAVPLDRPWPIRTAGFPEYDFIHDVVTPNAEVREMLEKVSEDSLAAYIQHLEDYGTRYVYSPQAAKAGQWLLERLLAFSYTDTEYQSMSPDGKVQLASANVVATKTGATVPGFRIIVGGHYDSIISSDQGDPMEVAPGADDNASGSAATLEIARLLADCELDATIQFALFTAEETGLHGSMEMATQLVRDGILPKDVFVLNMDMIANADNFPWEMIIYDDSLSRPLALLTARITEAYSNLIPVMPGVSYRSDHFPFQQAGYPAIFVHEGGPHPNYHTVNDRLIHLEMDYAAEVVKTVLATVLHMAKIASPPDAVNVSETASGDLLVAWNHSEDADVLGYYVEVLDAEGGLLSRHFTSDNYLTLNAAGAGEGQWVRVRAEDVLGESDPSEPALLAFGQLLVVGVTPNPTFDKTRLDLFLPGTGGDRQAAVRVFDASGRLVSTIHDGPLRLGSHRLEWDNTYSGGAPVPSGIYFYAVDVPGAGKKHGKIMVVR